MRLAGELGTLGEGHAHVEVLAVVAHLREQVWSARAPGPRLGRRQLGLRLAGQLGGQGPHPGQVDVGQLDHVGPHQVDHVVRDEQAEGREGGRGLGARARRSMPSSRAWAQACTGPPPAVGDQGQGRAGRPRAEESTLRTALAMLALTIRWIDQAASSTSRPSGRATSRSMARRGRLHVELHACRRRSPWPAGSPGRRRLSVTVATVAAPPVADRARVPSRRCRVRPGGPPGGPGRSSRRRRRRCGCRPSGGSR